MSTNLNAVILTGRIDGAVELKTSKANKPYARFTFVSVRALRESTEEASVNCVAFGPHAERIARNAGAEFFISGRLKTERWEWEGKPCSKLMLNIEEVRVLAGDAPAEKSAAPAPAAASDEPPF